AIADYTQNNGEGSDIVSQKRNIWSGSLLMKHWLSPKFRYEVGLRGEVSDVYDSPLLFSFGTNYAITNFYTLKLNASRNFRMPTYNDLYWQGSGDPGLNPETSYQAEIGNEFTFGNAVISLTGYYIKLRDMLRWIPQGSVWMPENVGRVNTYGGEAVVSWTKEIGSSRIELNGTYAYTVSNEEGKKEQLIYVPFHKATFSLAYSIKNITAYYRYLFNGSVFYTSDNQSEINAFDIATFGAEYHANLFKGIDIGAQVLNAFNKEYQNVATRPMPGRNYNIYMNIKF
ncbi:MAG: TonB-dependent receptor, partial [Flavobacterium sp.]